MGYRTPPTFVRNDLLTAGTYNQLRENGALLRDVFRAEHVNPSGEHNTPLIARTLGSVLVAAGPTYSLSGFNADASLALGHNPSTGKLILTLAANRYETNRGIIQVQNASNRGDDAPCLSWARWFDDTRVEIYSTYWQGTLGSTVDGAWETGGESGAFFVGVHGRTLPPGAPTDFGPPIQAGKGLRAGSGTTYANRLIQGSADLQVAMDVGHSEGVHDTREIAKYWGHIEWDGVDFAVLDEEASDTFDANGITVGEISAGICGVSLDSPLASNDYQVFIDVDYSRGSGSVDDYFIACVPQDEITASDFFIYLYKKFVDGSGIEYWDRSSEVDFHIWIHDDH